MRVSKLLDYISVKEAAEKWGISERRVQKLCEGNRIEGIVRFGHARYHERRRSLLIRGD